MEELKSNILIITETSNFTEFKKKISEIFFNLEKQTKGIKYLYCKYII